MNGHTLSYNRIYLAEHLPQHADDIGFLIVMGGPQSPAI